MQVAAAVLALVVAFLIAGDTASTIYGLHRHPAHLFENGAGTLRWIAVLHGWFPAMRGSIVTDLACLSSTLAFLAGVWALWHALPAPMAAGAFLIGTPLQARITWANVRLLRALP